MEEKKKKEEEKKKVQIFRAWFTSSTMPLNPGIVWTPEEAAS